MNNEQIIEWYRQFVMTTYAPSISLVRGRGARVWDADGREYLDFLAGIAVTGVGHCHPAVTKAIRQQAGRLVHVSNLFYNENQPRLAQALVERSGLAGGKCFFCNSGAEANEGLIKLGRLWGHDQGRYEILTMRNSFHGRTLATLTATGQDKVQKGFEPLPAGFAYADFNNLASVRAAVTDKTSAILTEAVQGEGGILAADPDFMLGLRALCDEKNLLLLCDEVQCGMGRTGRWFGYQHYGVQPDAFSLAKGLGNGYPIGAVVAGPKLANLFQPGHHASTFGGTPLACAAALATIETLDAEGCLENAVKMGALFVERLQRLAKKYPFILSVRGKGLMIAMVCDRPCKELEHLLRQQGLLALTTNNFLMRFLPPLNIKAPQVRRAVRMVDAACAAWLAKLAAPPPAG
ncbi:MAG: aspartate aminotransferase family protein [Kiritimatiellaeota bacterium]|nr:aspartate aminotransferase family protein [Kiritimatiellota bacterium]